MDTTKTCYLFFDLDGTVLTLRGRLEKETLDAMLAVQAMGHKLILNTGRSRGGYQLALEAHAIPWDGACFSSCDLFFEGRLLDENTVSRADLFAWLEYCMEQRIDIRYCGRQAQVLFDLSRYSAPLTEEDLSLLEQLQKSEVPVLILLNKCDLNTVWDTELLSGFPAENIISLSAASGVGVDHLRERIETMFLDGTLDLRTDAIVTNARQYAALSRAASHIADALAAAEASFSEDVSCVDLELAMSALAEVDGRAVTEDIVSQIFSHFCVGK